MGRTIMILTVSTGLLALGACGTLGERSTLAELKDRCDSRNGTLMPGSSEAEGGVRCRGATVNAAAASANHGAAQAAGQMSAALDRSMRNPM
ncbi:MAG: hypothetical protein EON88_00335 [Brevundimonas sp.]|nr:MAG: hypothetical protein EON88_00335 [Brevundimonas sp.]